MNFRLIQYYTNKKAYRTMASFYLYFKQYVYAHQINPERNDDEQYVMLFVS